MSKIREMFRYGSFEKRIVIVFIEHVISVIIWIIIDQYFTQSLFDNAIAKENIRLVVFLSILMIVKVVVGIIEGIIKCRLRHHLQRDFSNYARKDIFEKIINSNISYFDKSNTGELLELVMNDSYTFATFFTQNGLVTTESFFKVLTQMVLLMFINVKLTIILILCYFIGYMAVIISNRKSFVLLNKIRKLNISITRWVTEQINGIDLVKSLKLEEERLEKMKHLIEEYSYESSALDKIIRKYNIVYDVFSLLTMAIVRIYGWD